jgi:hypothetical protein
MPEPTPSARRSAWLVLVMLLIIAVPAGITLHTVLVPATLNIPSSNPTPYGYTWSLLLFIVPVVVIGCWLIPNDGVRVPKRAFWRTIWLLVPIGCGLDFFFAHRFFTFVNTGAVIGWNAPGIGGGVPIEEYVFYFTGFLAMLLIYVWASEYWMSAYNAPDYKGKASMIERLLKFHPESLIAGLVLVGAAILYKKFRSPVPEGFPGYFTVLAIGGLAPSMALFGTVKRFINWRAFSLTIFMILLISMFWEATLAVPYGWWGYQPRSMMGLFIGAWAGLPVEAVMVWMAVTYGTTMVYEAMKLWQASGKRAKLAFLGLNRRR